MTGCGTSNSPKAEDSSSKVPLRIAAIKASVPGNGEPALQHIIGPQAGPGDAFFESNAQFPISIALDVDPAETSGLKTYAFGTGNHGNDSILRMPRAWTLSGSDDGTKWAVLDHQIITTPWQPNEERRCSLATPSRNKHFRFELTQAGSDSILRIYAIRLYSN